MKTVLLFITLLFFITPFQILAKDTRPIAINKDLCFIENKGQITDQFGKPRNDIQFKVPAAQGLNIFIGNGQLHYQWCKTTSRASLRGTKQSHANMDVNLLHDDSVIAYRMDVELLNSNPNPHIITEEKQSYYENHFQAGLGQKGARAYTYKKITYKNIYPNIDWVLSLNNSSSNTSLSFGEGRAEALTYDFIVHPGGNIKEIKLKYGGPTNLSLNKDGSLTATTPFGNITEQTPNSYEKESNNKINSSFTLKDNILSFKADNHNGTLVIDPALAWATYYGGSSVDWGYGVACDQSGDVYMDGYTSSSSNIATVGSYLSAYSTNSNNFLVRLDDLGNVQWATYYYGDNFINRGSNRVSCDASGNVYLCGEVSGTPGGLATANAYQMSNAGGYDAYLAKLDGSGNVLWATFFGGYSHDGGEGVYCDPSGNVYLTGYTESPSGIATSGAYQTSLIGVVNQFLAKFNSSGSLQWSTYYGGSCLSGYLGNNLTGDGAGNIYICGTTCATSNIATTSAFQTSLGGGQDAYLAKFNSNGSLQWATYYGGDSDEYASGIGCDNNGNVFMSGYTASINNIASAGAYQASLAGLEDAFLVKFDSSGSRQWGTYYGGTSDDGSEGLVCNSVGDVYIIGGTGSSSGIATASAYQTSLAGSTDVFLAEFNASGSIVWATYFGGTADDWGQGINCDPAGNIYTCGYTYSTGGIATSGAYQASLGGGEDAFLGKWGTNVLFSVGAYGGAYCPGDTLHLPLIAIDTFHTGNVFTAQLSDSSGSFANPVIIGIDTAISSGYILCTIPLNAIAGLHYHFRIFSTNPADTTQADTLAIQIKAKPVFIVSSNNLVCDGKILSFTTTSTYSGLTYHWSGSNSFSSSLADPVITPVSFSDSGYYYVSDTLSGCYSTDTIHVSVLPSPAYPTASANTPCAGDTLLLTANCTSSGINYSWTGPNSFSSSQQDPFIVNVTSSDTGTYHAIFTLANGCADTINVVAIVNPILSPAAVTISVAPGDTICAGENITLSATTTNAGTTPVYQWKNNGVNFGPNSSTFTTGSIGNGDVITCKITSALPCQPIDTALSNAITMHVMLLPPPIVTITTHAVGDTVTFTGNVTNGSTGLTYQWEKNGVIINGQTQSTCTILNGAAGDTICLIVHSSIPCTVPDSTITCTTITTAVTSPLQRLGELSLYPNPAKDEIVLSTSGFSIAEASLSIYDISGREITEQPIQFTQNRSTLHIDLPSRVYILKLLDSSGQVYVQRLVICK